MITHEMKEAANNACRSALRRMLWANTPAAKKKAYIDFQQCFFNYLAIETRAEIETFNWVEPKEVIEDDGK